MFLLQEVWYSQGASGRPAMGRLEARFKYVKSQTTKKKAIDSKGKAIVLYTWRVKKIGPMERKNK